VLRRLVFPAAILAVLFAYAFFGSLGSLAFPRVRWDQGFGRPAEGYYASLAEGFLRGQLSMAHRADPRLMAMPHPYDFEARAQGGVPYLWDASYFNGKYYLYFSPLPALLFSIPFRLVVGSYPSDPLAATFFSAWAFVMAAAFVKRALAAQPLRVPLPLWVVMLGIGNVVPFVLAFCRTYEVAVLCGMAMSATWAWALLRFLEAPTTRRLVVSMIWLGLAIAARPNLGVLLAVGIAAAILARRTRALIIGMIPVVAIGAALLLYNDARFDDPLEFGHAYQLTDMPMAGHHVCGIRSFGEFLRFLNNASLYVFAPPVIGGEFPFVDLATHRLDPAVYFRGESEEVGGILPLIPLVMIGTLVALKLRAREEPETRAATLVLAAGWLALLGVSTCWFASARYEADFMLLVSAGAIVCIERGLALPSRAARIVTIILVSATILLGVLLGFEGTGGELEKRNPEVFRMFADRFR